MKVKQVLLGFDQLGNTFFNGYADEALSARAYRRRETSLGKVAYRAINALFFWQKDHCMAAYASEMFRTQLPREYRESM